MPVAVYKPASKTPYECVLLYRNKYNIPPEAPVSYAGRLDPMAEGVLLLLVGDENKDRRTFEHLNKRYEVACVFGISTDSGDGMGIPSFAMKPEITRPQLSTHLSKYIGTFEQRYHPYSSRIIDGKPLFYWSKQELIHTIKIPTHRVCVSDIKIVSKSVIKLKDIILDITRRVSEVSGDFRQHNIISAWESQYHVDRLFPLFTLKIDCEKGGTYVRVLIEDLAHDMDQIAFTYHLVRTRVGDWEKDDCLRLW
ncbi:MAG: hypothetical protein WCO78_00395 [Candidatus Roizmanbacteria bacterium]